MCGEKVFLLLRAETCPWCLATRKLIRASESLKTPKYPNLDLGTCWNSWLHTLVLGAAVGYSFVCKIHWPPQGPWAARAGRSRLRVHVPGAAWQGPDGRVVRTPLLSVAPGRVGRWMGRLQLQLWPGDLKGRTTERSQCRQTLRRQAGPGAVRTATSLEKGGEHVSCRLSDEGLVARICKNSVTQS